MSMDFMSRSNMLAPQVHQLALAHTTKTVVPARRWGRTRGPGVCMRIMHHARRKDNVMQDHCWRTFLSPTGPTCNLDTLSSTSPTCMPRRCSRRCWRPWRPRTRRPGARSRRAPVRWQAGARACAARRRTLSARCGRPACRAAGTRSAPATRVKVLGQEIMV